VPCRRDIFASVHQLAHAGTRTTMSMISACFAWPMLSADVKKWCSECATCARSKVTTQPTLPVESKPIPEGRFAHMHMDIVGLLPTTSSGFSYLFPMVHRTTRWPEVVPLKCISAQTPSLLPGSPPLVCQTWLLGIKARSSPVLFRNVHAKHLAFNISPH